MAYLRPTAIHVQPQEDYTLLLSFDNGERRVFDMKPYIRGEWMGELHDLSYFRRVTLNDATVEWPNEQDICPDTLYEQSIPV